MAGQEEPVRWTESIEPPFHASPSNAAAPGSDSAVKVTDWNNLAEWHKDLARQVLTKIVEG